MRCTNLAGSRLILGLAVATVVAVIAMPAGAATLYWDTNLTAAGAGNPANGAWATTVVNWQNLDSGGNAAGTGPTSVYVASSDVVFSAGSDAATATVTVGTASPNTAITIATSSILVEEGAVTVNPLDTTVTGGLPGSSVNVTGASPNITVNPGATFTLNTRFTSGTTTVNKLGTGTLELGGANTSTGTLNLSGGTTRITRGVGNGTDAGTLAFGSVNANTGGTLDLNGRGETATLFALLGGSIIDSALPAGPYGATAPGGYIQASGTSLYDLRSGTISARINGARNLDKTTTGTVTLSGRNSASGVTRITDGRLIVTGILNSIQTTQLGGSGNPTVSGGILVNGGILNVAGAGTDTNTFDDTGRVGQVQVIGGTLAPGAADDAVSGMFIRGVAGGGLTVASGGTLEIDIAGGAAGTGYDQVRVSSPGNAAANNAPATAVSLAGTLSVDLLGSFAPVDQQLFFIITQALNAVNVDPLIVSPQLGPVSGTFANASIQGGQYTFDGQLFEISYTGDSTANGGLGSFTGGDDVVLRAIVSAAAPEPATLAVVVGMGAIALRRRRRTA